MAVTHESGGTFELAFLIPKTLWFHWYNKTRVITINLNYHCFNYSQSGKNGVFHLHLSRKKWDT